MARFLRTAVLAVAAGTAALSMTLSAALSAASIASADTVAVVSPGMEIRQGGTMCTLGFVDPVARVAFSAGHCNASGPVTDRNGRFIGVVTTARDNTPDGTVVRTDQVISDYETISLASDVTVNASGGALKENPIMASGLIRIGHAADHIFGGGNRALAHSTSGPRPPATLT